MNFIKAFSIAAISLLALTSVSANDSEGFEEDGFEEDGGFEDALIVKAMDWDIPEEKPTQIDGNISFETHYNTENRLKTSMLNVSTNLDVVHSFEDKSKLRLNIKANKDFIFSSGISEYSSVPEGYESNISIDQLSFEKSISPELDMKLGRQIVTWGVSDLIRVNDSINPTDNRVPGLTDIKDLKLGAVLSRFDYYPENDSSISYQAILINEHRFSLNPRYGSDFKSTPDMDESKPNNTLKNTGFGLAIKKSLPSADASFYFLNKYIDKPYTKDGSLHFDNKAKSVGMAYNVVKGSFLIKAEANYIDKVTYNLDASTLVDKPVSNILLGFDYNGFANTNITYEVSKKSIGDYDVLLDNQYNMNLQKNTYTQALRGSKRLLNDELEINAMVMLFGKNTNAGGVAKIGATYDYTDDIDINAGYIDYLSSKSNPFIDGISDNNRLFLKVNYKF